MSLFTRLVVSLSNVFGFRGGAQLLVRTAAVAILASGLAFPAEAVYGQDPGVPPAAGPGEPFPLEPEHAPLAIIGLSATYSSGVVTVSGVVMSVDETAITVAFGDVLSGHSVSCYPDGSFFYQAFIGNLVTGTVTAQATCDHGSVSNVASADIIVED